ncbi:MAG: hypothetical protein FWF08_04445 [Oscillospiraceae bacterium]|nr:hypothetical protein [Oscillospiraceae bacterium]
MPVIFASYLLASFFAGKMTKEVEKREGIISLFLRLISVLLLFLIYALFIMKNCQSYNEWLPAAILGLIICCILSISGYAVLTFPIIIVGAALLPSSIFLIIPPIIAPCAALSYIAAKNSGSEACGKIGRIKNISLKYSDYIMPLLLCFFFAAIIYIAFKSKNLIFYNPLLTIKHTLLFLAVNSPFIIPINFLLVKAAIKHNKLKACCGVLLALPVLNVLPPLLFESSTISVYYNLYIAFITQGAALLLLVYKGNEIFSGYIEKNKKIINGIFVFSSAWFYIFFVYLSKTGLLDSVSKFILKTY